MDKEGGRLEKANYICVKIALTRVYNVLEMCHSLKKVSGQICIKLLIYTLSPFHVKKHCFHYLATGCVNFPRPPY